MIEIIKLFVDVLSKLASVFNVSERRRVKGIGQKLFLVYFRANEVIDTGEAIIVVLKNIKDCVDIRTAKWGEDVTKAASVFTKRELGFDIFEEQCVNLYRLHSALSIIQTEFKLLDPETEKLLRKLIVGKNNALQWVSKLLRNGKIILGYPQDQSLFIEAFNSDLPTDELKIFLSEAKKYEIDVTDLDDNSYFLLSKYLDSGEPEKRIREFRSVNNKLRNLIEKYWSLQDILLGMDILIRKTL